MNSGLELKRVCFIFGEMILHYSKFDEKPDNNGCLNMSRILNKQCKTNWLEETEEKQNTVVFITLNSVVLVQLFYH